MITRKTCALLTSLLFLSVNLAFTQNKIEFIEYDLPNGLHVILHKDDAIPLVSITMNYHVGSKDEDSQRKGFTHLFEHLMFEGSDHIKRGDFFSKVMNAGGNLDAVEGYDKTFYFMSLPSNKLELGLWMESERMHHLRFDSIGLETQRNVVIEERRQRYDNRPYGNLMENILSSAFTDQPYKWMPIGPAETVKKATMEELRKFYSVYYVPNNAILSIAGNIDYDETRNLVDKYFSKIPRGNEQINHCMKVESTLKAEIRDTVYENIQLPLVALAYRVPQFGHPDSYTINVITALLSEGKSSRLNKSIVYAQQKTNSININSLVLENAGLLTISALARKDLDPYDLEKAINKEIDSLKKEDITEKELGKVINLIETRMINRNSTLTGIAESLSDYYLFQKNTDLINMEVPKHRHVTPSNIRKIANKYFIDSNRVVLYYLPKPAN